MIDSSFQCPAPKAALSGDLTTALICWANELLGHKDLTSGGHRHEAIEPIHKATGEITGWPLDKHQA